MSDSDYDPKAVHNAFIWGLDKSVKRFGDVADMFKAGVPEERAEVTKVGDKFYIAMNTTGKDGLEVVSVTIKKEKIKNLDKKLPINLKEHPLYHHLKAYVENNK